VFNTLFALVIVVGVITPDSPLFSDENYHTELKYGPGITNDRVYFYPYTGLLNNLPMVEAPDHCYYCRLGLKVNEDGRTPFQYGANGLFGFYAGSEIYIIDVLALGNPLLSKLPLTYDNNQSPLGWRIGHFLRAVPQGYFETLASGENMIEDKCLAKYYDKLSIITRGNLFDANRFQEIWKMNTGQYDYLLDAYIYGIENSQYADC